MTDFLHRLLERGHFVPTEAKGCFGLGPDIERLVTGFGRHIDRVAAGEPSEKLRFPPLVPRSCLHATGFMESMPHMAGLVSSFQGDEASHRELVVGIRHREDWSVGVAGTDLALAPSACYPLYPTCRGDLPAGGRVIDLGPAYVFRREPSDDPARLQAFRMREIVRLGRAEEVLEWRDGWIDRGMGALRHLGLQVDRAVANDPFYGRGGVLLAEAQRAQRLKVELRAPIGGPDRIRALASFNYHMDHFGGTFGIQSGPDVRAHSACLGFGLERVALALLWQHGLDLDAWPEPVLEELAR